MLRTGVDPDEVPFFIMGTHKNDESCKPHVLSPPLMDALHKQLPYSCSQSNFWLKYSLVRDGASIDTLAKKISLSRNAILAIETMDGDVFGSFHTKVSQQNRFIQRFDHCVGQLRPLHFPQYDPTSLNESCRGFIEPLDMFSIAMGKDGQI